MLFSETFVLESEFKLERFNIVLELNKLKLKKLTGEKFYFAEIGLLCYLSKRYELLLFCCHFATFLVLHVGPYNDRFFFLVNLSKQRVVFTPLERFFA